MEFLFCLVLAEVLTRLSVHPVPESFIHTIEDLAFRHFKQQESIKDRWGAPVITVHYSPGLSREWCLTDAVLMAFGIPILGCLPQDCVQWCTCT